MKIKLNLIIFVLSFIVIVGNSYGQKIDGIVDLSAPVLLSPLNHDTLGINDTALVLTKKMILLK